MHRWNEKDTVVMAFKVRANIYDPYKNKVISKYGFNKGYLRQLNQEIFEAGIQAWTEKNK